MPASRRPVQQAKPGDTVKVHYTGTLDDGSVFDSSDGRDPLEFTLGEGMVVPGFEALIDGLAVGETKKGRLPPEKAYGPHIPEMAVKMPRAEFPPGIDLEVGLGLQLRTEQGQLFDVTITAFDDKTVTLDGNHPLAGKALTFEVTLVEIAGASEA